VEGVEEVVLFVDDSQGGALYRSGNAFMASAEIVDDPPVVSVTASGEAAEGGPGTATLTFSRSGGDLTGSLDVHFTVGGSAGRGSDYTGLELGSGTDGWVQIAAGQSSAVVGIVGTTDALVEGPETVVLTLVEAPTEAGEESSYLVGLASVAEVVVADAAPRVWVTATDAEAAEAGQDPARFTLWRSGDTQQALTIHFTVGGLAGAADYTGLDTGGSVVFPAGAGFVHLDLTPVNDSKPVVLPE
jgi:hypothetical protein